jgi:hypothetical protein
MMISMVKIKRPQLKLFFTLTLEKVLNKVNKYHNTSIVLLLSLDLGKHLINQLNLIHYPPSC